MDESSVPFRDDGRMNAPTEDFRKEYLDARFWNPECSNFELMDWDKWESLNPAPPKIFDPPQQNLLKGITSIPLYWYYRSCYLQPIPMCLHKVCAAKPEMERISEDVLYQKMLNPNAISKMTPAVFKNHLIWTENNVAPETLVSFNSWAWRSQTGESRVVGLGNLGEGWTNDPTCLGWIFSQAQKDLMATIQISPNGKWILLGTFSDPSSKGTMSYNYIYVVQEGDIFQTPDGKKIDHVNPGDLVRVTWGDNLNPYECDNTKLKYMYFPRRVASLNSEGEVVKNQPHYDDLLRKATNKPSASECCSTCCFTCSCFMSPKNRFDFQVRNISDKQVFAVAPMPPLAEVIERL